MTVLNLPHSQVLTRSRTLLFLSYRHTRSSSIYPPRLSRSKGKQKQTDDVEQQGLLDNHDNTTTVDMDDSSDLPPRWVDFVEEVEELTDRIKPKMVQLDKLTAKHVLPGFTDRTLEERQIEELTTEITQGFRKCQLLIRKIADYGQEMEAYINRSRNHNSQIIQPKYTNRDVTLVKNAQIAAATKVQGLSTLFQKRQRVYLEQLKGYEKPDNSKALFAIEDDADQSSSHLNGITTHVNDIHQQQEQVQSIHRGINQDIEQRSKEIDGIAKSISELADMFKDLGNLVLDQGTLLDRIDYNVEQMSTDIRGAAQELKTATQHQKRSSKCRIIFLLVLLIFAAVLVLVYKPRRSEPRQDGPVSGSSISDHASQSNKKLPRNIHSVPTTLARRIRS